MRKNRTCSLSGELALFRYMWIFGKDRTIYWKKLSEGGDERAQQCGWLKDKYGVSWQVVPRVLIEMLSDPDYEKSQRAMMAMLQMKKIDIAELKRASAG